ncbi:MAG: SMC family ATPase, partial [Kineosporiaceae bacterium]
MRLHTLRLRAFGPFAAEQTIDFDRLTAGGLFLLEGPTGAGKTTILDAITFALYGGLSSDVADKDRLHSDFADPAVEPQVVLDVSLRGVRHRITRVPEHQRPRKRGDGFTREPTRVHLERGQDGQWTSLSSNKAEVAEIVGEAVGLTREQFTQVAMLPQGEFARFLRSDDDERRILLTRLFGTGLYDRITAELDRRRAEATRHRDEARARIASCVSAALEAAGLDGQDRDESLDLTGVEQLDRLA